jgi:deoxyuridine 5'-triphosphate nucleotidohydrolase
MSSETINDYFLNIDSDEKAYYLGYITACIFRIQSGRGFIITKDLNRDEKDPICIYGKYNQKKFLNLIKTVNLDDKNCHFLTNHDTLNYNFDICCYIVDKNIVNDIFSVLKDENKRKNIFENYSLSFTKGYFEMISDVQVNDLKKEAYLRVKLPYNEMMYQFVFNCFNKIKEIKSSQIVNSDPNWIVKNYILENMNEIMDLLNIFYSKDLTYNQNILYTVYNSKFKTNSKLDFENDIYRKFLNSDLSSKDMIPSNLSRIYEKETTSPECIFIKTLENAVEPSKPRYSDIGYDLTIIKKGPSMGTLTTLYDTGISVKIMYGYYAEVVPRSSLSKTGYMLANSMGIIDRTYTGNIMIALIKLDSSKPDIQLPFKGFQIIIRKATHVVWKEEYEVEDTDRGNKGFGSSG